MIIQLINSPLPFHLSDCLRSKSYPPLHLLSLATYLKKNVHDVEVEILDGEILGIEYVINNVHSDIVGISCNSLSYESAIDIASRIKDMNPNAVIVLGGAHATNFAEIILRNRNCFDFVVGGQGEKALVGLIKKVNKNSIPNLTFNNNISNSITKTRNEFLPLDVIPPPNFHLTDLRPYFTNFKNHYPLKLNKFALPTYSSTGCQWRIRSGGCIYCSIPSKNFSQINPSKYWAYLERLNKEFDVDFIWDVSDTFTSNKSWLKELSMSKPKQLDINFHIYARTDDLDEECLILLKKIGVSEVLVGIESFDNAMLKQARKGISEARMKKALNLLNDYDISVALSFVLGLPGETVDSLTKTYNSLGEISWMDNIIENHASVLIPLPGSMIFNKIMDIEFFKRKYFGKDLINLQDLQYEYLDYFTECGSEVVYDYYLKIDSLFNSAGPFYCDKNSKYYQLIHFKEVG